MKFLKDRCKRCQTKDCINCVKWYSKDYFFAGTLFFIILCVVVYAFAPNWQHNINESTGNWEKPLYLWSMLRSIANAFNHTSWQHLLLNMLVFFVCGLYLERKTGTLYFVVIVLGLSFVTSMAITANNLSTHWAGFSGINYGLFAYVIINYIFSFKKSHRNTTNIVLGAITLVFIYLFMCFKDNTAGVETMTWYPHGLIYNLSHYTAFLSGIVFGLIVHFTRYLVKKETKDRDRREDSIEQIQKQPKEELKNDIVVNDETDSTKEHGGIKETADEQNNNQDKNI